MASSAKPVVIPRKFALISEHQILYFRRLTQVASVLQQGKYTTATVHAPDENNELGQSVEVQEALEEEGQAPATANPTNSTTLTILRSLASLVVCKNKIVAVVSGKSKVILAEESMPSDEEEEEDLTGGIIFSRNPRWSTDLSDPNDQAIDWIGEKSRLGKNFGIRSVKILPAAGFQPPMSPERPTPLHVGTLFPLVKQAGESQDYDERVNIYTYLIRIAFPKMGLRASEHCPSLSVPDEDDGDDEDQEAGEAVTPGAPSVKATGKDAGDASGQQNLKPISMAATGREAGGASGQQKRKPKQAANSKAYDYGGLLIPSASEKCDVRAFQSEKRWGGIHKNQVQALQDFARVLEGVSLDEQLPQDLEFSEDVELVMRFSRDNFHTTDAPTTFRHLHSIFGAVFLSFIAGIKTLLNISTVRKQKDLWDEFTGKSMMQLGEEVRVWLRQVGIAAASISVLTTGEGDKVFMTYLGHVMESPQHVLGCQKYLQLVTEHYNALNRLLDPSIQKTLQEAEVTFIDIRFREGERDVEMMPLDKFFENLRSPRLTKADKKLLLQDIERSQGSKKSLNKFNGTVHAETVLILLALMARSKKGYKQILTKDDLRNLAESIQLQYIGVSKKCCPVCTAVVSFAHEEAGVDIKHTGSHEIYSACTLPPWTPASFASRITALVEARVLEELIIPRSIELNRSLARRRGSSPSSSSNKPIVRNGRIVGPTDNSEVDRKTPSTI
ncbi:hypothetical protein BJ508DRAFT_377636 [Ascobolus immersus RN42]|uniref:Uncharacterized protein n=1 Tax=Ascobolus immersus RN42 TaxID=1160509 RepID=A0A3N4HZY4_ASCIM|nr:hypothetical protein BJ508DRAFT_377636 [Ascobolus immersus RN42]